LVVVSGTPVLALSSGRFLPCAAPFNEDRAPEGSSNSRHTTGSRKSYKTESPAYPARGFKDKAVIRRYCGELRARLLLAPSQGNGESKIPERMPRTDYYHHHDPSDLPCQPSKGFTKAPTHGEIN